MKFTWATLPVVLGGCSLLFEPVSPGHNATQDAAPGSNALVAISTIGSDRDFNSIAEWQTHRQGDITSRQVFEIEFGPSMPTERRAVSATNGDCAGEVVPTSNTAQASNIVYLDDVLGVCEPGAMMQGGSTAFTLGRYLGSGVIERAELLAGTYTEVRIASDERTPPWKTSRDFRIEITAVEAARHKGRSGEGVILTPVNLVDALVVAVDHTMISDLEITGFGQNAHNAVLVLADGVFLDSLLIHDEASAITSTGVDGVVMSAANGTLTIQNSIFHSLSRTAILVDDANARINVFHVSVLDCMLETPVISAFACLAIDSEQQGAAMVVRNSVVMAPTGAPALNAKAALGDAFLGSSDILVRNGDASDFPALGAIRVTEADPNDVFSNTSGGAVDLHLKSTDTAAANKGMVLDALDLDADIDDELRMGAWDLGADERL